MGTKLWLSVIVMALSSCKAGGDATVQTLDPSRAIEKQVAAVDMHTSQNALDWSGTYKGTLPCADCEGIKTTLTLRSDGRFTRFAKYLGKDRPPEKDEGTFAWDAEGRKITLTARGASSQMYQVGEDLLFYLDQDGSRITGDLADKYILRKSNTDSRIENKKWVLTELMGEPIKKAEGSKNAFLALDSEQGQITGNGSCNNFFGTYELQAGDRIDFGKNMGSTMMACSDMRMEITFMELLQAVESYATEDNVLWLNTANSKAVARFILSGEDN